MWQVHVRTRHGTRVVALLNGLMALIVACRLLILFIFIINI